MRTKIYYEWWYTFYELDEAGEVDDRTGDTDYCEKFEGFGFRDSEQYVRCELVRRVCNPEEGDDLLYADYAEIDHGSTTLPETFDTSSSVKIPKKFHAEVARYIKANGPKKWRESQRAKQ